MRKKYLGDSYDLVKRFWSESLRGIAPLFAHPRFIPSDMREEYTALTDIPVRNLERNSPTPFGLLLDPDTGIHMCTESPQNCSRTHASLPFILEVFDSLQPRYMICFDQSYHRRHKLNKQQQLDRKREFLESNGVESFYYDSHAHFLFMSKSAKTLNELKSRLIARGVPPERFELKERR